MGLFSFLFGKKSNQIQDYLNNGAKILDVRTEKEYDSGHLKGSLHIPLGELNSRIGEIKKLDQPVITCCASGMRSAKAAKVLNNHNINAINGGAWVSLQAKL